jgi:hypothetical protein
VLGNWLQHAARRQAVENTYRGLSEKCEHNEARYGASADRMPEVYRVKVTALTWMSSLRHIHIDGWKG